ncbi:MAG: aminomethyl-transferring glycine dehydrogenase subunit GcvPB [Kiritimatiellaeota bacterium]|nr:aminomethyl-transferring glycine dehydrogenase subunit GcvPB [Kiritimatiellota bacterium]
MQLIFEKSRAGLRGATIRPLAVPEYKLNGDCRRSTLNLPEVAEPDMVRHYTALSRRAFGVDNGFYPLGSCTMKYNPKINEEVAALDGFASAHPLQDESTTRGCREALSLLSGLLCEITGMDGMTLAPAAGAHGEYTALLMMGAYHRSRGDSKRNKIIVPDSAHGTNPASVVMAGFETVNIKSDAEKGVDIEELKRVVGPDTAGLMLTNPTTLGLFEKNIRQIAEIVHDAGGLMYYDGANLNAIMGIVRPGDMGFDIVHLNLHKTFSTPHGGGGPGSGPVGCKAALVPFLNIKTNAFHGNFAVCLKALAYILTLGADGLKSASETAVLNANYLKANLQDIYPTETGRFCMHEFVISAEELKKQTGVSAMDLAKGMIDRGMHPPTVYFPLTVHEALMFEPTETENKSTLDNAILILRELRQQAFDNPESLHAAPITTPISRPDDVAAARNPKLKA